MESKRWEAAQARASAAGLAGGLTDIGAYDLLSTAVLLLDQQGRVQYANTAAEELFGSSRRQLIGLPAHALFDTEQLLPLETRFDDAAKGRLGSLRLDVSISGPAGPLPVSVTINPLVNQVWAALLEARLLEQHTFLNRHDQASKELAVQRESLRNLAHEIKNPLGGLRGAAQLLASDVDPQSVHEYTDVIIAEADRLASLVDRLITPQGQSLLKTRFNVHELCERVYTLLHSEFGRAIKIARDYDASLPELTGDFNRLLQALLNVARNAAQSLSEQDRSSSPTLTLRTRVGRQLPLANGRGKLGIIVSVIDNGPGIPESLREKVFHPLVSGRANGTGLGLSLAQEFVAQHGGLIEFDSGPGHTEFRLILLLEPA